MNRVDKALREHARRLRHENAQLDYQLRKYHLLFWMAVIAGIVGTSMGIMK